MTSVPLGHIGPKLDPLGHIGPKLDPLGHIGPKTLTLNFDTNTKLTQLQLTNGNNQNLRWNAQIKYIAGAPGWLQLSQSNGQIGGNTHIPIDMSVDTSTLTAGTYEAVVGFDWEPPEHQGDQANVTLVIR